jgi:hypothetical protein
MAARRAKNEARKAEMQRLGDQFKRRKLLVEVRQEAAEFAQGLKRNADPAEAVQEVLDNLISAYQYATQKMMELPTDEYWVDTLGGKVVHEWIREQERLGLQVVHVAGKASAMGLAERQVRLQEAQAAIFASVVDEVLKSLGLGTEQRYKAHELIAARLDGDILEGTETKVLAA